MLQYHGQPPEARDADHSVADGQGITGTSAPSHRRAFMLCQVQRLRDVCHAEASDHEVAGHGNTWLRISVMSSMITYENGPSRRLLLLIGQADIMFRPNSFECLHSLDLLSLINRGRADE
jgi:hypothetical protein